MSLSEGLKHTYPESGEHRPPTYYRTMVRRLGIPTVPSPKERNKDQWEEVRAMEQLYYLRSWVYTRIMHKTLGVPYSSVLKNVIPVHRGRSDLLVFLETQSEFLRHQVESGVPPEDLGVAALGALSISLHNPRVQQKCYEVLADCPVTWEFEDHPAFASLFRGDRKGVSHEEMEIAFMQAHEAARRDGNEQAFVAGVKKAQVILPYLPDHPLKDVMLGATF